MNVHLRHHTCTTNVFIHIPFGHLSLFFGIKITGNGIALCLSYFSCCSLKKATKGGKGLFWLTVQGYNPSWQGSYRSWRQPVTIEPQFRVESDTWWMFLFVHSFFIYSSGNSATHRVVLAPVKIAFTDMPRGMSPRKI